MPKNQNGVDSTPAGKLKRVVEVAQQTVYDLERLERMRQEYDVDQAAMTAMADSIAKGALASVISMLS